MRKFVIALAITLSMTGCATYSLEKLRHTTPSGTPFQNELSKLYMQFATEDEKGYDWFNSWHFADKGLMLAYGKERGPEELADWDIPKEVLPVMEKARAALMAVLTPEIKRAHPGETANAQFYFDCWVQRQDENWQEEEITYCHDNLAETLAFLHAPDSGLVSPEKVEEPPVVEAAAGSVAYVVLFEKGQPVLSAAGKKIADEVIQSLENAKNYRVIIHKPGGKRASALAAQRAWAVQKRLIDGGVPLDAISADGKPESSRPSGHRVEIFLNE